MPNITQFALDANRLTVVFILSIVLLGVTLFLDFPRQEDPPIVIREVVVTAFFPGMDSRDIEELVTRELETELRTLPELDNIWSSSMNGVAIVQAETRDEFDDLDITEKDRSDYSKLIEKLEEDERGILALEENLYVVDVRNVGGLVSPVILEVQYEDGTFEELRIPAEIWRKNTDTVSKLIMTSKTIERIVLDPHLELADVDLANNTWPPEPVEENLRLRKWSRSSKNPMQAARDAQKKAEEAAASPEGTE